MVCVLEYYPTLPTIFCFQNLIWVCPTLGFHGGDFEGCGLNIVCFGGGADFSEERRAPSEVLRVATQKSVFFTWIYLETKLNASQSIILEMPNTAV